MSSFYAELTVDGQTPYPLRQCQFEFTQATDQRGRAAAKVRHGLLHLTLDVPTDDQLLDWANTVHKPLSGHVTFFEDDRRTARETLSFAAGQCVSYHESFVAGEGEAGAYVCQLIITSAGLTLARGGAAQAFVAPTAREYETTATTASAQLALPVVASPAASWHEDLATLMGPTVNVPALITGWVATGLDESMLRSALQNPATRQIVFERLQNADKGIYQHRVIVDDYGKIPGVSERPYKENGLPDSIIPASNFGIMDEGYNLPARNALTFTSSAVLTELKPGEKIYRVTNDPATDQYASTGGYWTRTPPAQLQEVIGGTAVMPEWNNFQKVYELTVPADNPANSLPKIYAWEGPTAAQPVSGLCPEKKDNGYCLAGGAPQLFLPNKITRHPDFSKHIRDVTSTHKSW